MASYGQPPKLEREMDDEVVVTSNTFTTPRDGLVRTANRVESYNKLAEFDAVRASYANMAETLHKRALVYSGVGGALFVVFISFAAGLYSFQSIRVANIALSLAFIGLLLFVTLTGIAFLTVFDMGKANDKEVSPRVVVPGEGKHGKRKTRENTKPRSPKDYVYNNDFAASDIN